MEQKLKKMSKEELGKIILEMTAFLTKEQQCKLEMLIAELSEKKGDKETEAAGHGMPQIFVDEKMEQIKSWMKQIDEGELYLETDEYEDYSSFYWDSDWIIDYYDNQGIGERIITMIRFAKDCVDDKRYENADFIYEWLWGMFVTAESEYGDGADAADIEKLVEEEIISVDLQQVALLTLYTDYQVSEPEKRAEDIYSYFSMYPFQQIHMEDMFRMGRENLSDTEQFWRDWIALLETKSGEVESRLLTEAVLYSEGPEGLLKKAAENVEVHPSMYLSVMKEYGKSHDYEKMESAGEEALAKIDKCLVIRSKIALEAAYASSCEAHLERMMKFCWEGFVSNSTVRNFLRLFGMEKMAERYGMRGKEVLCNIRREKERGCVRNEELRQNKMSDNRFYELRFYMGDFETAMQASRNPEGSLGWSGNFIYSGIRLFLLYLYSAPLPTKAASAMARQVGLEDSSISDRMMKFEMEIAEESNRLKTSQFWNYFQRWKVHFPMEQEERRNYLTWAEKIVYQRADAIVGGKHRGSYGDAAALLALVAEVKEGMGAQGEKREIYEKYKSKFPRHSSFQAEMRNYFDVR